jgi:predicted GNAT superfamily acetyltransferase
MADQIHNWLESFNQVIDSKDASGLESLCDSESLKNTDNRSINNFFNYLVESEQRLKMQVFEFIGTRGYAVVAVTKDDQETGQEVTLLIEHENEKEIRLVGATGEPNEVKSFISAVA